MKKAKKSAAVAALVLCCLSALLSACSPAVTYRDDVSANALMADIQKAAPIREGYRSVEDDYLSPSSFGDDMDLIQQHVSDWAVAVSDRSDAHPDEILIVHVTENASESLQAVTEAVRRYGNSLQTRLSDYYRMYAPEELPKLENLSVKVCGNYVLLTILDEAQTRSAQTAFEQALV